MRTRSIQAFILGAAFAGVFALALAGCEATALQVIPTDAPTATATFTPAPSRTPGRDATPTLTPTRDQVTVTGGPSPTPLLGATREGAEPAPTAVVQRPANPNAPRIEFFTSDVLALAPGTPVTLFWSTRGTNGATIYRLDAQGLRSQLWNVPTDGSLVVQTSRRDRGQIDFILSVGEGANRTEQALSLPFSCPDAWFFEPGPEACPDAGPRETELIEQSFETGRMAFARELNRVFVLFNDGYPPAWVTFDNRYDPAIHPELEENFVPPPPFVQPVRQLGYVWRGNDLVRSRLGMGVAPEAYYDGFVQIATTSDGAENIYFSSADGSVLALVPGGEAWQIITPPSS